jgi:hypothetical protein
MNIEIQRRPNLGLDRLTRLSRLLRLKGESHTITHLRIEIDLWQKLVRLRACR